MLLLLWVVAVDDVFTQGQLYVFSTCMVFHANLIAVVKAVRIAFKVGGHQRYTQHTYTVSQVW